MSTHLEAVYENGVFRPLQSVELADQQRVMITIDTAPRDLDTTDQASFALSPERWRSFCDALDAPPRVIPALRQLLTEPSIFDDNRTAAS